MLTLTDSAVSAIRGLASQPDLPEQAGLRIMTRGDDASPSLQLALAEGPSAGDEVVEADGARVFLEPAAVAVLDGKSLDARVTDQGQVAFSIFERADS